MYDRQPKVILTNVLKTEIGRKYIKTQLITDITHGVQLQSDQQTSPSVDSVEIREILSLLQQNLFISRRYVLLSLAVSDIIQLCLHIIKINCMRLYSLLR